MDPSIGLNFENLKINPSSPPLVVMMEWSLSKQELSTQIVTMVVTARKKNNETVAGKKSTLKSKEVPTKEVLLKAGRKTATITKRTLKTKITKNTVSGKQHIAVVVNKTSKSTDKKVTAVSQKRAAASKTRSKIGKKNQLVRQKSKASTINVKSKLDKNSSNTKEGKSARLTKKILSAYEEETLGIRPVDRGSSWDGNSEADGSVNSGVLDENQCFECGMYSEEEDWSKVALCDVCDGEYHMRCSGLQQLPRLSWTCNACREEREWFRNMSYVVHSYFKIPRRPVRIEVCYSPSRPLALAFQECLTKGFMIVKRVFPIDVMKKLTHGKVNNVTKSGRVADRWEGAVNVIAKRFNESCHNIINRGGRFDLKLPVYVVAGLELDTLLQPMLDLLRTIMPTSPAPILRTHNVVFVPVGTKEQEWHVDDSLREGKKHSYFTILIHLNSIDDMCGGTEIWSKKLKRGDMIRPRPGDAFVFNGSLLHRGFANNGYAHRFFYYASFSCRSDTNELRAA